MGTSHFTAEEVDNALTAVIAYSGNVWAAIRYLDEQGMRHPSDPVLRGWIKTKHWERYEELREKFAAKRETTLVNNYLDVSIRATEAMDKAVDRAIEKLEKDEDNDPGRTAANLMMVARAATDKRLTMQGKPTQISENRDATQILRGLMARYPQLIQLTDEDGAAAEIEAGAASDDA